MLNEANYEQNHAIELHIKMCGRKRPAQQYKNLTKLNHVNMWGGYVEHRSRLGPFYHIIIYHPVYKQCY